MVFELTFEHPEYLWLLLSLPLVAVSHFFMIQHTKKKGLKFANFDALRRVHGSGVLTRNLIPLMMRLLILFFLIVAVCGTIFWYSGQRLDNDVVIAIDTSASMTTEDIEPSRFEASKKAAVGFVQNLSGKSKIGVVVFSGIAKVVLPPSASKTRVQQAIESIEIEFAGGTDIAGALIASTNLLATSPKGKAIVLFTDGSSTVGVSEKDTLQRGVDYAVANHVVVHPIGLGSEEGTLGYIPALHNVSAAYDKESMEFIAEQTEGKHYLADNTDKLNVIFEELNEEVQEALIPFPLTFFSLLIALLLLFIEWGLINTRFRVIP